MDHWRDREIGVIGFSAEPTSFELSLDFAVVVAEGSWLKTSAKLLQRHFGFHFTGWPDDPITL